MISPSEFYNQNDLLVWALFLCGGDQSWVDVEALYLKAFELGPASLSWRTRLDIPDYKKCAKALQSLEDQVRSSRPGFLSKRDKYTRMLSPLGIQWCRQYQSELSRLYQGAPQFSRTSEHGKRVSSVKSSTVYSSWIENSPAPFNLVELSELLRCSANTSRANWEKRLNAIEVDADLMQERDVLKFVAEVRLFLDEERVK
jgi:hypothetical protein